MCKFSETPKGSFINHVDSLGGRGGSQMSTLLYNPYIVKWSTVIPRLVRSLRVRILGMRSFEDVQNDSGCAF